MRRNNSFRSIIKRIPYSTTSIDHQNILNIMEKADDFEKVINKRVKQLEHQNINISTCPEYLENMVDEYIAGLLSKLETEHVMNMHVIGYLFRRRASDKVEFQELLNRMETEIASTKAEYELIVKFAEEMNPLTNGKLVAEIENTREEDKANG